MAVEVTDRIKNIDKKKVALGGGGMLSLIGVIIFGSIIPLTTDFENIGTTSWWVNEIFVVVIAIWSIITMMYMGQAYNAGDERSNIAKARKKFNACNEQIVVDTFIQWVEQRLEVRDQLSVNKRVLREVGCRQPAVVDLPRNELKSLLTGPQRIDQHWYDEITEEQFNVIMDIKNGKYNIQFVNPRYYLTEHNIDAELTVSERALREDKIKQKMLITELVTKVITVLLVGVILSSFTRDVLQEEETAVILLRLFSRLGTAFSGSFAGYMLGTKINDVTGAYLQLKADIMHEQLNDKEFKPKSIEEIAKEKFANNVRRENQKMTEALKDEEKTIMLGGS